MHISIDDRNRTQMLLTGIIPRIQTGPKIELLIRPTLQGFICQLGEKMRRNSHLKLLLKRLEL